MTPSLSPEKALVFRITHFKNLAWILDHGLHAQSSRVLDPNFVSIGLEGLIEKRKSRIVGIAPFGFLSDYVPFYFTPYSRMMYNIHTGYRGVTQQPNENIAVLVTSLHRLKNMGIPFVFTDGHAYTEGTRFFNDLADLNSIDWEILQTRSFSNDPEDPGKGTRYQAEALAYRHVPVDALLGIVCYNEARSNEASAMVSTRSLGSRVVAKPEWYFK